MVKLKVIRIDRARTFPIPIKDKLNKKTYTFERVGIVLEYVLDHKEQSKDYMTFFREQELKIRNELNILESQIRGEYK